MASFGLARKVRMEDRLLDNTGHRLACVGATAGGSSQLGRLAATRAFISQLAAHAPPGLHVAACP